jgi:hypothetical protein
MIMRSTIVALLASLALVLGIGCDPANEVNADDSANDVLDNADKADGVVRPVGTYTRTLLASEHGIVSLTLKTDKTFHRVVKFYCPPGALCQVGPMMLDGTYGWSKSGSTRYIRFLDDRGDLIDRYAYTLDGNTLSLRSSGSSTSFDLTRVSDEGWCSVDEDCQLQDLTAQLRCPGYFTCQDSACVYQCGIQKTPCAEAGGSCVALYPGNCADGVVGSADEYSCGGGLGVMCCLPKPEPVTCGGFRGALCAEGQYCDPEPGMCHGADISGTCKDVTSACAEVLAPVCGCNGVTYDNDCERIRAGVALDHTGRCEKLCRKTGCSGQICADRSVNSTCEWLPTYACYNSATCEVQADGNCGWTPSDELTQCLAGNL